MIFKSKSSLSNEIDALYREISRLELATDKLSKQVAGRRARRKPIANPAANIVNQPLRIEAEIALLDDSLNPATARHPASFAQQGSDNIYVMEQSLDWNPMPGSTTLVEAALYAVGGTQALATVRLNSSVTVRAGDTITLDGVRLHLNSEEMLAFLLGAPQQYIIDEIPV